MGTSIEFRRTINKADLARAHKPQFYFDDSVKLPSFENLNLLGAHTVDAYGNRVRHENEIVHVLGVLPHHDLTELVERRYDLPPHILLALIVEGSGGIDLLPYHSDDGRAGLIPVSSNAAALLGLTVSGNRLADMDKNNGRELRHIMKLKRYDRGLLCAHDERLHNLALLDAIGRKLATAPYMSYSMIEQVFGELSDIDYRKRWNDVVHYANKLNEETFMNTVRSTFDEHNSIAPRGQLRIDGQPASYEHALEAWRRANARFGTAEYATLELLRPVRI